MPPVWGAALMRRATIAVGLLTSLMGSAWLEGSARGGGRPIPQGQAAPARPTIDRWVDAVQHHEPGAADAAVTVVWELPPDFCASPSVPLFVKALLGHGAAVHSIDQKEIVDTAAHLDPVAFLERAAVLHADAALLQPLLPRSAPAPGSGPGRRGSPAQVIFGRAEGTVRGRGQRGGAAPTPCSGGAMVVTEDGEYDTSVAGNWNWAFARQLLESVPPSPKANTFVALWYQATGAALLQHRYFSEARTHLTRAVALFPNDAQILFALACTWEALGLPTSQAVRRPSTDIPTEGTANGTAEGLFRRAVDHDPGLVEARARLARLLDVSGHNVEAADQLAAALASTAHSSDSAALFYAHLFATRVNLALGHSDVATAEAEAALSLFPRAQSALIAQSHVRVLAGDIAAAMAPLGQLQANLTQNDAAADPWLLYLIGPGRTADQRLRDMWTRLPH